MDREGMEAVIDGIERITDKIRALHAAGFQRGEIATFLGRRYQQVRNVIKDDERRAANKSQAGSQIVTPAAAAGESEAAPVSSDSALVRIGRGGIVEIPSTMIERLKIAEGDRVLLTVVGGELRLLPRSAMIAQLKTALS